MIGSVRCIIIPSYYHTIILLVANNLFCLKSLEYCKALVLDKELLENRVLCLSRNGVGFLQHLIPLIQWLDEEPF